MISKTIMKNGLTILRVTTILVFLYLAGWAIWLDFAYPENSQWFLINNQFGKLLASGLISVAPELAGIVIGVLSIDYLNERRQDKQLLEQLILQMSSRHNDVTETAVAVLKTKNWLSDGSLVGAHLAGSNLSEIRLSNVILRNSDIRYANLTKTDLHGATLNNADFSSANLSEALLFDAVMIKANLSKTNLNKTVLSNANMKKANLNKADLNGAFLLNTNLHSANLEGATLYNANLSGADLTEAILKDAIYNSNTKWPDGFDPDKFGAQKHDTKLISFV